MSGFASDGSFTSKTLEEINDGFVAQQRANIDTALDTSQFSVIGQLNGIMASELAGLWEVAEELHDAIDPDKAVGAQQDGLYALTGAVRRGPTKSTVVATVVLAPGANVAAGTAQASVLGNAAAKFTNVTPMVNLGSSNATVSVTFHSVDNGPVLANAGTLTEIDTPIPPGWVSITNALDAEPGSLVEGNPAFRRRREDELAAQGGGTVPGLRGDLLRLKTVRIATVVENDRATSFGGMPPKSIEAVVISEAGASDESAIAQTIFDNKAAGIESYGSESHDITDSEGVTHTVKFSRPTDRPIYVALRLKTDPTMYSGDEVAKVAIVASAEDPSAVGYLDLGADVYAGRMVAAAMGLAGVINAEARLSFDSADFDTGSTSLVIEQREIASLDTSRITIAPFP